MATINKQSDYTGPFSAYNDNEALALIEFFLYYAAPKNQCPLSLNIEESLSEDKKTHLIEKLFEIADSSSENFIFSPILRNRVNRIEALGLSDANLTADRAKGFLAKKGKESENDDTIHRFDSFVRHIRNSLAHGRVRAIDDWVLFEDWYSKELSARIILPKEALPTWVDAIEDCLG